jgi:hypothetical protein
MVTLYLTKTFRSGALVGLSHTSSLDFVSVARATEWVKAVKGNRKLNYDLTDHSFQSYQR